MSVNGQGFFILLAVVGCLKYSAAQIGGVISPGSNGGHDLKVVGGLRTPDNNAGVGAFASGNSLGGPVSTGVFADANKNGHGLSASLSKTPGFGTTVSENARLNVLNRDNHNLDVNAFHSRTKMENGYKFDRMGGNVDYNNNRGFGATAGVSHIPQIGRTNLDLTGRANVWKSQDLRTTLDVTGSASRSYGGPFRAQNNYGVGLGMTHRF